MLFGDRWGKLMTLSQTPRLTHPAGAQEFVTCFSKAHCSKTIFVDCASRSAGLFRIIHCKSFFVSVTKIRANNEFTTLAPIIVQDSTTTLVSLATITVPLNLWRGE
jgi:hypothetical protein